ncbi:MAG: hypothetical protein ACFB21_02535 [Opitutales bacterium]
MEDSDVDWCTGWLLARDQKIEGALDIMDEKVHARATGVGSITVASLVDPCWNEGGDRLIIGNG